jgi:hypothetical protein
LLFDASKDQEQDFKRGEDEQVKLLTSSKTKHPPKTRGFPNQFKVNLITPTNLSRNALLLQEQQDAHRGSQVTTRLGQP